MDPHERAINFLNGQSHDEKLKDTVELLNTTSLAIGGSGAIIGLSFLKEAAEMNGKGVGDLPTLLVGVGLIGLGGLLTHIGHRKSYEATPNTPVLQTLENIDHHDLLYLDSPTLDSTDLNSAA